MQNLEARLAECERQIHVLEKYRETDQQKINSTKNALERCTTEITNLIKSVDSLPESIEKSMTKSFELYKKDNEHLHDLITKESEERKKDNALLEKTISDLEKTLDERTIKKENKLFSDIKYVIISCILTTVLGFILGMILK